MADEHIGLVAGDLAEVAARFGAALRRAGLPVGPGRSERFATAITLVGPVNRRELFDCALATLVSSKDQAQILLQVFTGVFGSLDGPDPLAALGLPGGSPPRRRSWPMRRTPRVPFGGGRLGQRGGRHRGRRRARP